MIEKKLSKYIQKFAYKRLAQVECANASSNQHEFNGMAGLKSILGSENLHEFPVKIAYMSDIESEILVENSIMTWYDSRKNNPQRSPEFRLYYQDNEPMNLAKEKDLFIFFETQIGMEKEYNIIICPFGTTSEKQLCWLFDIENDIFNQTLINQEVSNKKIDSFVYRLLDIIGICIDISNEDYTDDLIQKFGNSFPKINIFSEYARSFIKDVDPVLEPDKALVDYFEIESVLFKTFENYIVGLELKKRHIKDVDYFISYSLSVQNTRKVRAGKSFENHIKHILEVNGINFSYNKPTENNKKPDFLFPNIGSYSDSNFNSDNLYMLAAKTTCKERWKQVLSEADKIKKKHLITMEPAISENQTTLMIENNLQLVIPTSIQSTYNANQVDKLISFKEFISLVN